MASTNAGAAGEAAGGGAARESTAGGGPGRGDQPHDAGPGAAVREPHVFNLDRRPERLSDGELVEALRRYCALVDGRAFSMAEFDRWKGRPAASCTISHRLGTWRRGLARAGITGGRVCRYLPEELVRRLEAVWRETGRAPGIVALRRRAGISAAPYVRRWGSLARACEELARYHRGEISRGELLRGGCGEGKARRALRPRVRWAVLERDGHRCAACGKAAGEPGVRLEVDHIVPVSAGGTDEVSNLRVLCEACNRGKGARQPGRAA